MFNYLSAHYILFNNNYRGDMLMRLFLLRQRRGVLSRSDKSEILSTVSVPIAKMLEKLLTDFDKAVAEGDFVKYDLIATRLVEYLQDIVHNTSPTLFYSTPDEVEQIMGKVFETYHASQKLLYYECQRLLFTFLHDYVTRFLTDRLSENWSGSFIYRLIEKSDVLIIEVLFHVLLFTRIDQMNTIIISQFLMKNFHGDLRNVLLVCYFSRFYDSRENIELYFQDDFRKVLARYQPFGSADDCCRALWIALTQSLCEAEFLPFKTYLNQCFTEGEVVYDPELCTRMPFVGCLYYMLHGFKSDSEVMVDVSSKIVQHILISGYFTHQHDLIYYSWGWDESFFETFIKVRAEASMAFQHAEGRLALTEIEVVHSSIKGLERLIFGSKEDGTIVARCGRGFADTINYCLQGEFVTLDSRRKVKAEEADAAAQIAGAEEIVAGLNVEPVETIDEVDFAIRNLSI
jgi:hypothetical protein